MERKTGFTLIELLVVIAIIAILAAIIFPVYYRARDSANRSSDMTNMNNLRTALQLYRVDQGAHPPALLGYVTLYSGGLDPSTAPPNDIVPAHHLQSYLYPRRVQSIDSFRVRVAAANDPRQFTRAVWPCQEGVSGPPGCGLDPDRGAVLDLTGDGSLDDLPNARQAFGPNDGWVQRPVPGVGMVDAWYYSVSGYDVATVETPAGARNELRYTLFWTNWGLGANGASLGHANDDPRQLGYTDPPESTVITWNSFYRDYENGVPTRVRRDIVLYLGGNARMHESRDLQQRSWRIGPFF
jgi:prepilin-type N-terminal cleavage/methylation domain-containing protein